jgi:hypothetical protein
MSAVFPGTGHRYLVDFKAFRVALYFESEIDGVCSSQSPISAVPTKFRRDRILAEHDLFGKPDSTRGSSPRAGFFRIML